jgi:putative glutamine transport system permease protein
VDPVIQSLPLLLSGLATTVELTVLAGVIALSVGVFVAMLRVSGVRPLQLLGAAYVEFVRNVPLLVHMFFWVYGLPFAGVLLPEFVGAFCGLGFYTAAFVAEVLRSGVLSIHRGQFEAARALGLSYGQMMQQVVLPQAFATVVPPLGNLALAMTKNTAVASSVTVPELLYQTQVVNARTFATYEVFFVSAALYLLLTLPLGKLVSVLEKRLTHYRPVARA